jgi:hypothetical protein
MTDWTPVSDFDNFDPPMPGWLDPNWPYPDYVLTGIEPSVSGIPDGNPNVLSVRLGRVVAQGTIVGTFMVRTFEGWLLDNVFPHNSYSPGDFIYLLVCGQWCIDMGQHSYLPPVPPLPAGAALPQ